MYRCSGTPLLGLAMSAGRWGRWGGGGGECQEERRGWQKDPEDTQTDNSFGTNLITTTLQYKEPIDCQLLVVCIGTKDIQLQPLVANQ